MASLRNHKIFCLIFFIGQLAFSMNLLMNEENAFPFFNWKIFHTRPDKYWTRNFIFIHEIDGTPISPALDILDMKDKFPDIFFYSFNRKITDFAADLHSGNMKKRLDVINENLTFNHTNVKWELIELKFDIIDFHKSRSYISKQSRGFFSAQKETENL